MYSGLREGNHKQKPSSGAAEVDYLVIWKIEQNALSDYVI